MDRCAPLPDKILSHPGHPVRLSNSPPATNRTLPSVGDRQQPELCPRCIEGVSPRYVTVTTIKCDAWTLLAGSNIEHFFCVFVVAVPQQFRRDATPPLILAWSCCAHLTTATGASASLRVFDPSKYLMLGLNFWSTLIQGLDKVIHLKISF